MIDPMSFTLGTLLGLIAAVLGSYFWWNAQRQRFQLTQGKLEAELAASQQQSEDLKQAYQEARQSYENRQAQIVSLTADLSRMAADYENLTHRMVEREQEVKQVQDRFKSDFEVLANRILTRNTEQLSVHNREQLTQMLEPLKEKIHAFEQKVSDTYEKESRERFHLQKEIEQLAQLNQQMSEDAHNLTRALKGDSKIQGNWGEMILSRVLQSSGLREGEEFVTQESIQNEEGRRLQPDVVVRLPDEKHIVIDAKVSLKAYEQFASAENEQEQAVFLKKHLESVLGHVKGLSDKRYQGLEGLDTPDFVLLFLPIEAAFSLALQAQPDLFHQAWERRIVVVSPTTLLATLRTVASIWKLERQNRNAMEIARQGGLLYDRFVSFVDEMDKIGKHLDQASRTHQDAMRKLKDGRGNLAQRAEKLRDLGVKNSKELKLDTPAENGQGDSEDLPEEN